MEVMNGMTLMLRTAPEDSSSDDDGLPMYLCALCNDVMMLGRGGALECATCRSHRVYKVGDTVLMTAMANDHSLSMVKACGV